MGPQIFLLILAEQQEQLYFILPLRLKQPPPFEIFTFSPLLVRYIPDQYLLICLAVNSLPMGQLVLAATLSLLRFPTPKIQISCERILNLSLSSFIFLFQY